MCCPNRGGIPASGWAAEPLSAKRWSAKRKASTIGICTRAIGSARCGSEARALSGMFVAVVCFVVPHRGGS